MKLPKRKNFRVSPLSLIPQKWRRSVAIISALLLLSVGPGAYIMIRHPFSAEAAWFNSSWNFRQQVTLTVPSSGTAAASIPVKLTINTSTLISASKMQSACQDLRFTNSVGTVLPYYLDSGCNTTTTKVWVQLDNIPASTTSYTMYMYYGNLGAAAGSDSSNTYNLNLFNSLVGYWTMNDGSGSSITDSSVNTFSGTFPANDTFVSGKFSTGINNSAAGAGPSVSYSPGSALDFTSSSHPSIAFWYKSSTASQTTRFMTGLGVGAWGIQILSGSWEINTFGGATGTFPSATAPSDGLWHHFVVTYDGTTAIIYQDGNSLSSLPYTAGWSSQTGLLYMLGDGSFPTNGALDDLRIYKRVLTPTEVTQLYNYSGSILTAAPATIGPTVTYNSEKFGTSPATDPIAYWKFDEGTGTTANNSSWGGSSMAGILNSFTSPPITTSGWMTEDLCLSGKCLKFNGTNNYISTTNLGLTSGTVSMWVYPTTVTGDIRLFSQTTGATTQAGATAINQASGETGSIWVWTGTVWVRLSPNNTLLVNKWFHLEFVYSGTTVTLYVNGVAQYTGTTGFAFSGVPFGLGAPYILTNGSYFSGKMDEIKIYSYARTAAQVNSDFNQFANTTGKISQAPITNGLVGYWKFDENTGTTLNDWSGTGNNGTITSGTWGNGKFGPALSFNGTTTFVGSIPNTNFNFERTNPFSGCAWINPTDIAGTYEIFSKVTNNGTTYPGWEFFQNLGTIDLFLSSNYTGTNFLQVQSTTALTAGQWNHVCFTYDGSSSASGVKIYINNVSQPLSVIGNSLTGSILTATNFQIGKRDTSATILYKGSIDEGRIYNRTLTPAEVSRLYSFAPEPVGYWDFNERTGTTANDFSGYINTSTWGGTLGNQWIVGKYGGAGNFNGIDNYLASTTTAGNSGGDISLEMWLKPNTFTSNQSPIDKGGQYTFQIDASGNVYWADSSNYNYVSFGATNIGLTTGQWQHLAFTKTGGVVNIYLNGVLKSSKTFGGLITSTVNKLMIGCYGDLSVCTSGYFNGGLDEVKVYSYARTQAQIQQDMRGDSSIVPELSLVGGSATGSAQTQTPSAIGIWHFNEGYGTTANNAGSLGTALTGTMTAFSSPATGTSGWQTSGCKIIGNCLAFNGSTNFITAAANSNFTTMSASAWVYLTTQGCNTIAAKGNGSSVNADFIFDVGYNGTNCTTSMNVGFFSGGAWDISAGTIPFNTWTHILVTYDGTTKNFYINGKLNTSVVRAGSIYQSTSPIYIGEQGTTCNCGYLAGKMQEVHFYNFAMNQDQVNTDYNYGSSLTSGVLGPTEAANDLSGGAGNPPIAYWNFNERTGSTVNDRSGNAYTGTWNGTPGNQWTAGVNGAAGNFNGTNNYVNAGTTIGNFAAASPFSVSVWINPNQLNSTNQGIVTSVLGDGSSIGWQIRVTTSNTLRFLIASSTGAYRGSDTSVLTTGKWQHIEAVWDGTNAYTYVNGILNSTAVNAGTLGTTTGTKNLDIGYDPDPNAPGYFTGKIDEVKIYNYARSQAQVAYDYNRGGPVAWYKLDECQGSAIHDSSGWNNTGTLNIGGTGTQTAAGTCTTASTAWGNGTIGKFNSSLNFDGTDDNISVPTSSASAYFPTDVSVAAWIKTTKNSEVIYLVQNGNPLVYMQVGPTTVGGTANKLVAYFRTNAGTVGVFSGNTTITDGNWHHVAIVRNTTSQTANLYVDGKLDGSFAYTDTGPITATGAGSGSGIGSASPVTSYPFQGQIDDVRVYNYALSATQIRKIINDGSTMFYGPATGSP